MMRLQRWEQRERIGVRAGCGNRGAARVDQILAPSSDAGEYPRSRQWLAALLPSGHQPFNELLTPLERFLVGHAVGVDEIAPLRKLTMYTWSSSDHSITIE